MWNLLLIGWITVVSSVGGADVMVDEQDGIRMQGKRICLQVEAGRHLVMVDKEGYIPYIDTIRVGGGENLELNIRLESKSKMTGFDIQWIGVGGGIGTGLNIHLSVANMHFGWFTLDPCMWGMNLPFISGVSHVKKNWLVHPKDRRSEQTYYNVAIPSLNVQFYYTPMVGMQIPIGDQRTAIEIGAGPQISWTHVYWSEQERDLPTTCAYEFTNDPFPKSGFQFDPVWFSAQIGVVFKGIQSDLMAYFKYQDGYFIGIDFRL